MRQMVMQHIAKPAHKGRQSCARDEGWLRSHINGLGVPKLGELRRVGPIRGGVPVHGPRLVQGQLAAHPTHPHTHPPTHPHTHTPTHPHTHTPTHPHTHTPTHPHTHRGYVRPSQNPRRGYVRPSQIPRRPPRARAHQRRRAPHRVCIRTAPHKRIVPRTATRNAHEPRHAYASRHAHAPRRAIHIHMHNGTPQRRGSNGAGSRRARARAPALVGGQEDVPALALHQCHHVAAAVKVGLGNDAGHAEAAVHPLSQRRQHMTHTHRLRFQRASTS
jgi:hypothetical protein